MAKQSHEIATASNSEESSMITQNKQRNGGGKVGIRLSVIILTLLPLLTGCPTTYHTKGGRASDGLGATLVQSDDPKNSSRQASEHERERTFTLPAGSRIHRETLDAITHTNTFIEDLILAADTIVSEKVRDKVESSLGAAQKSTIQEMAVKLQKAWPIMVTGIALIIGGFALIYFQWYTKGALAIGCGILCFVMYYVIPLHAGAIALGCLGLFAFLAILVLYIHYKTKLDVNQNWIPDFLEKKKALEDAHTPK